MSSNGMEEYYQKVIQLQERLRQSEQERLKLEMRFNEMLQVMKEEEEVHFKKLRTKYKQFLEEDRRRQQRNDKILEALDRIENRAQIWEAKTEKFKVFRKRYHGYLKQASGQRSRSPVDPERTKNDSPERGTVFYDQKPKAEDARKDIMEKYLQSVSSQKCKEDILQRKIAPESKYSNLGNINSIYWKNPRGNEKSDPEKEDDSTQLKNTKDLENALKQNNVSTPLPKDYGYSNLETGDTRFVNKSYDDFSRKPLYDNDDDFSTFNRPSTEKETREYKFSSPSSNPIPFDKEIGRMENLRQPEKFPRAEKVHNELQSLLKQHKDETQSPSLQTMKNEPLQNQPVHGEHVQSTPKQQFQPIPREELKPKPPQIHSLPREQTQPMSKEQIQPIAREQIHPTSREQIQQLSREQTQPMPKDQMKPISREQIYPMPREQIQPMPREQNQPMPKQPIQSIHRQPSPSHDIPKPIDLQSPRQIEKIENILQNDQALYNEQFERPESALQRVSPIEAPTQPSETPKRDFDNEQTLGKQELPVGGMETVQLVNNSLEDSKKVDGGQSELPQQYSDEQKEHAQQLQQQSADRPLETQETPQYDVNEQPNQQFDENGQYLQQYYDENAQPLQQYDEHGQPLQQYDENGQPLQQYDQNDQPLPQYDENGQPLQQYYDETGQIQSQYDENGQPLQQYYDENGQVLQQYDEHGQAISQYDENGQPIAQYDEGGQPLAQYDPSAQIQYDENGQPIVQYDQNGQPLPQYDENGQPLPQYDEHGQALQQYYDENGQPVQYYGNGESAQQYDENGQPIQQQYSEQAYGDQQQYYDQQEELRQEQQDLGQPQQDLAQQPQDLAQQPEEQPKIEAKPNVLDILDTDTESAKQDTKISNDSDFDFSNG